MTRMLGRSCVANALHARFASWLGARPFSCHVDTPRMRQIVPSLHESFREHGRLHPSRPQYGQPPASFWPKIFVEDIVVFPAHGAFTRRQLDELANAVADFSRTPCFFPEFNIESGIGEEQLHAAFHFGPDCESAALSELRHTTRTIDVNQIVRDLDFASASLG